MTLRRFALIAAVGCSMLAAQACAPPKVGFDPVAAADKISEVEDRYLAAKAVADMVTPFLPASAAVKIRKAEQVIETALVAARLATDAATQLRELNKVRAAIAGIEDATVDSS